MQLLFYNKNGYENLIETTAFYVVSKIIGFFNWSSVFTYRSPFNLNSKGPSSIMVSLKDNKVFFWFHCFYIINSFQQEISQL